MDAVNESSAPGTLRFVTGPLTGKSLQITKSITTLGRDPNSCDIVINDPAVSRQHAQLIYNGSVWSIKKLAQQNVMTLNQREITQSALNDHDTIGLGQGTTFIFTAAENPQVLGRVTPPQIQHAPNAVQPAIPLTPPPAQQPMPPYNGPAQLYNGPGQPGQPGGYIAPPPGYAQQIPATPANYAMNGDNAPGNRTSLARFIPGLPSIEISTNVDHEKQLCPLSLTAPEINIGRDPSNEIVINRPTVSSFHVQIIRDNKQLTLIHPHPKRHRTLNGLTFQGRTIQGDEQFRRVLQRGDIFRISDENGTFVSLIYNDGSGEEQEPAPQMPPIQLGERVITLGRANDNRVVLQHPQISAHHARLEQLPRGGYRIIDLNSTNHIYVNTERVHTHQVLAKNDIIRIGPYKLTYTGAELTQQDDSQGVRIDAINLRKEGNKHVILLDDISLVIPPRKFVALVGGSGAGKSTLMDALNGLRPAHGGSVLYNGQDYYANLAAFSTQLGYVPQEDIIHRELTVERALYYAAKLRLPQDFTEAQIHERIDEVLDDVEMQFRRSLLVSKLSGGQRKRVSIALELLAKPSIFFLDEPTSGLDPGLDRKMMLLLRKLADKGHTIVLVTHATNNINACDYICFLCQGGRVAYFGPPDEAKAFFGKTDFAEIYSALEPTEEHPEIPAEAETRFRQSPDYQKYIAVPMQQRQNLAHSQGNSATKALKHAKRGNPWKQFILLCIRYLELIYNDKVNLAILVLQAPIIGALLFALSVHGMFDANKIATCATHVQPADVHSALTTDCTYLVNFLKTPAGQQFAASKHMTVDQVLDADILPISGQDAQKILFIMAFASIMFGCLNGAREIVKEAPIYRRERSVNLGLMPYLCSKFVVLGAFSLVQSLVLVGAIALFTPYSNSVFLPPFLEIYISLALTGIAGLMTGLLISALVPNNDRAMSIVSLPLIPQVIFSGTIFNLDHPSFLQIPGAIFAARWAMAAMGTTAGIHPNKVDADNFSFVSTIFATVNGNKHAQALQHLLLCWGVLVVIALVQALIIAWCVKRKDIRR
ncbi:ABC transporter ATP-binding protein [Ktedonobacteria bacterium brp13]|nr:ABC transporter ATP-binding protein [Ktedonobacteria bacterium brp13]